MCLSVGITVSGVSVGWVMGADCGSVVYFAGCGIGLGVEGG